jgi:hypothetical protein
MCAIGRDLDTSVGAKSPATAMLGTGAIGVAPVARRTLLTGTAGRTGTGSGGTVLAPGSGGGLPGGGPGGGGGGNMIVVNKR